MPAARSGCARPGPRFAGHKFRCHVFDPDPIPKPDPRFAGSQELMAGAGWRPGAPGHDGLLPPTSPGGMQPQLSIPYLMQHARLCARGLSPGAPSYLACKRRSAGLR